MRLANRTRVFLLGHFPQQRLPEIVEFGAVGDVSCGAGLAVDEGGAGVGEGAGAGDFADEAWKRVGGDEQVDLEMGGTN